MHPVILTELAAARHAELLRTADLQRRARLPRPSSPDRRRAHSLVATVATSHLLRGWRGRLSGHRSTPQQSGAAVCCA